MAKKQTSGKNRKPQPASTARGKSGKHDPQPAPARKPADHKSALAQPAQAAAARRAPGPPLFTPAHIALLAAGLALLGCGAMFFARIQFGHAPTGLRPYASGFALFAAGLLVPCLGIAPLRRALLGLNHPGNTTASSPPDAQQ